MKSPIEEEAEEAVKKAAAQLLARIEMLEHQVDRLETWKNNLPTSNNP